MKTAAIAIAAFAVLPALAAEPPSVRVGGAIGERFETCMRGNFLKCDLENDFFRPFVERKGGAGGFVGLGKHADAAVHFAKNSGDPEVVAAKEKIVGFIVGNQLPDGYTGFFAEEDRLKRHWDIHEMGFIVQALMSDWELFGNRTALDAAKRNVDYVLDRWNGMPDNWEITWLTDRETTLGFGFGAARLYAATKDERYRSFLRVQRGLDDWDCPIVVGRDRMLYGQAYGYAGTCLEQLELYRWDPAPRYLRASLRALDFQTRGDGLLIDGNGGVAECWTNDQDGEGDVGETCNVAFELLFWDALARLGVADRALLGDLMERAVYNALFGATSADGRRVRYYTPLNGERKFWKGDTYCCPNNFRRAMSRLPEYLLYSSDHAVLANLYTACEAELSVVGDGGEPVKVRIVEDTDYPRSGRIRFAIDPEKSVSFAFKVRVPRWCRSPSVRINGMRVPYKFRPGQVLDLPKAWKSGDVVELDFPMEVRTVRGRKRQSGRFAVMRGPVVYSLDTKKVREFEGVHPHDAQTVLMMDPNRLEYRDGKVEAVISTTPWAVGVDDVAVDQGREAENVRRVWLEPFASESVNLTYFRAPNIEEDCRDEDELLSGPCPSRRPAASDSLHQHQ